MSKLRRLPVAPEVRLLSVAEIARRLGVPESTVHYWKNRFAQHLPSQGSGRQKRFRPEAVDVFRVIAEMFSLGHSTQDVMETLGKRFPLTAALDGDAYAAGSFSETGGSFAHRDPPQEHPAMADTALRMAAAMGKEMGLEIARSIGEGLRQLSRGPAQDALDAGEGAPALPSLDAGQLEAIRSAVDLSCSRMDAQSGEVERVAQENADLKTKLSVLEAELIRLRKDRREMEKYLLDKIKSMAT
ncbi:MAG: helix-turn-helix domain-containing protein [Proteobacteria bacterium]|nr:helix-turn-helix domain-containing protein [Pseudomonadota bacterium]MBU1595650.1 helix-turn-helix domain-containing protein [Pseudomonadota bacterium]